VWSPGCQSGAKNKSADLRQREPTIAVGAEKAHENDRRPRQPTILHPLVEKKMGKLPD
jgi:hypothetical protein